MSLDDKELGKRLKMTLDVLGYSQESFGVAVGKSQPQISSMANGRSSIAKEVLAYCHMICFDKKSPDA